MSAFLTRTRSCIGKMFVLLLMQAPAVVAQDESAEETRGYLAVSLGPSIPTGQFASKQLHNNTHSGFANTGAIFDVSFAYTFRNGWGLSVLARGQANMVDEKAYTDRLLAIAPIERSTVESDPWISSGYLIGGYRSYPIGDRFFFDFRAMVGIMMSRLPAMTIRGQDGFETVRVARQEANATSFATLIGVGLKYDVGRRGTVLFNVDYWGGTAKYTGFSVTSSRATFGITTETSTSVGAIETNLNTLNLAIGYGFRF